jgi:hypothetical protein
MRAQFVVGGEFDIATPGEVREAVDDGVGKLSDLFEREKRPLFQPRLQSLIVPASTGNFYLNLGSPPAGKMWKILRAGLTIINQTTANFIIPAATQQCALYAGTMPQQGALLPSLGFVGMFSNLMIVDPATPYPVFSQDTLFVALNVTVAFAAAARVAATVMVAEYRDASVMGGVS